MVPNLATKVKGTIFEALSWWWEANNPNDQFARTVISLSVVILAILWYVLLKGKSHLPPGPRGLPLVGNLPFLDPDLHNYFAKLAKVYGPIFKIKLGSKLCVVLGSPVIVREVLRDNDIIFSNRDSPRSALAITYGGLDMAWAPYNSQWRILRTICVQDIFSKNSLDATYILRREEVRQTLDDIYSKINKPINIGEQMFLTMLNLLTSMLWGGKLKGEERSSLGQEFKQVIEGIVELLGKPNISDLFPVLARFDIQGIERKMKSLLSWFDRIFDSVIDRQTKLDQANGASGSYSIENKDILEILLMKVKDQGDSKAPFTITNIKALFMDIMVAGTDTTTDTVEWAMAETMKNPRIMKNIQEELDKVVGRNKLVEEAHLLKLHYLNAVVKETFRLHPAVPLLVPRRSGDSCIVNGYAIPKGTRILVNAWSIQRDPDRWENPLEFQPERFLRGTSKWDYSGNDFRYIPFGSGRRRCVGVSLVERMVPYVFASLLHMFEWRLSEGTDLDLSEHFGIVLKMKTPLIAIPIPRFTNPELHSLRFHSQLHKINT
ncbi:hypothetical protein GIB67_013051 [Kingdonia uniflora]|uniref:Cytochrome P450 n=1 Tax=Kingdonia uniflora TaxID=39325 RepID=A0A7J7MCW3_9MAGN|nr:hypothetical protein GIB67_013051 [Kingdonia uniflora]